MALTKSQRTGILGAILVFFIPLLVVSYVYVFSKKPTVGVLPILGEQIENSEDNTITYHTIKPFSYRTISGVDIDNAYFKENVRIVQFGEVNEYEEDYIRFQPIIDQFLEYPELQFLYHLRIDQNNSLKTQPPATDNWHVVVRSSFGELPMSYLLESVPEEIALVDNKNQVRGIYGTSETDLELPSFLCYCGIGFLFI